MLLSITPTIGTIAIELDESPSTTVSRTVGFAPLAALMPMNTRRLINSDTTSKKVRNAVRSARPQYERRGEAGGGCMYIGGGGAIIIMGGGGYIGGIGCCGEGGCCCGMNPPR